MFKLKQVLTACFVAFTVVSCSQNEQSVVSPESVDAVTNANARSSGDSDALRENVARKLAKALGNAEVRAFIKTEVLKKFDGDYDLLLSKAMAHIVAKYPNSELAALASSTSGAPLLNIAVPVKAEDWDTQRFVPLVAFLPENFDEKTAVQIKAFDSAGNVKMLDAKETPSNPVVVISNSERVRIEQGKVSLIQGIIDMNGNKPSKTKGARLPGEQTVCGVMPYEQVLYLTGFASNNIGAIESWANGRPEIMMNMYYTDQASQVKHVVYGDGRGNLWVPNQREDVDNRWWRFTDRLVRWSSSYGDVVNFAIWEQDGGPFKPIDIEIKGKFAGIEVKATTQLDLEERDEYIGVFPVDREFCTNSYPTPFGNQLMKFMLDYYQY